MPLGPRRLSSRTLRAAAGLLRAPGARTLVQAGFLQFVHLDRLHEADLRGVAPWRAGTRPDGGRR